MDDSIDTILDALAGDVDCLVKVATARRASGPASVYVWSSGRILATVAGGLATIERRFGQVTEPNRISLNATDLASLGNACAHWAALRDNWAEYYETTAGYPPGWGCCGYFYQPPGRDVPRIKLGERGLGRLIGRQLQGRTEVRGVAAVGDHNGVRVVAELWRVGEKQGPGEAMTGQRLVLPDGLQVETTRSGAMVCRSNERVHLEAGEEAFLAEVRALLGGH